MLDDTVKTKEILREEYSYDQDFQVYFDTYRGSFSGFNRVLSWFKYTNHRGETRVRSIEIISMCFDKSEYYPEPQWLVKGRDLDRNVIREFALNKLIPVEASNKSGGTTES